MDIYEENKSSTFDGCYSRKRAAELSDNRMIAISVNIPIVGKLSLSDSWHIYVSFFQVSAIETSFCARAGVPTWRVRPYKCYRLWFECIVVKPCSILQRGAVYFFIQCRECDNNVAHYWWLEGKINSMWSTSGQITKFPRGNIGCENLYYSKKKRQNPIFFSRKRKITHIQNRNSDQIYSAGEHKIL